MAREARKGASANSRHCEVRTQIFRVSSIHLYGQYLACAKAKLTPCTAVTPEQKPIMEIVPGVFLSTN